MGNFIIVSLNESQVAQMLDYLPQYTPLSPSKFHAQTLPLLSSPHPNPSPFPVSLDTDIDQEICWLTTVVSKFKYELKIEIHDE